MNLPPETYLSVPHHAMHAFISAAGQAIGLPGDKAAFLAQRLLDNDLRGVFSHGSQRFPIYVRQLRNDELNPDPQVRTVTETPTSLVVDGDGGLGYYPAYHGTLSLIEKAKTVGIAVLLTRNHGHIGAAGIYTRLTLDHDLLCFVTSGHQLSLSPGQPIFEAAGGSPFSFSAPSQAEDSLVLDFGTMHDLYASSPHRDEIARKTPGIVFRSIGMGAICQAWGGLLAGVPLDPGHARREYPGANQGALVIAFQIALFMSPDQFKREMDDYVRAVSALQPLEGFDRSYLPGGVEAARERLYRQQGIPVGPEHRQALEAIADELGLRPPWENDSNLFAKGDR
jgi:L-2-hydroxycarboxylate dehydrogenase (NAD+)